MQISVSDFYDDKNVFVTGVTGFLGKAIVEKLLRQTNVNRVYVLMREKRGKNIHSRLNDVKKNMVFERLKREKGQDIFNKLIPVSGDVSVKNLQLSENDEKILENDVHVVIHSAAALDFELNSKIIININLIGTKRLLDFCTRIRCLKAFIYVSSAYVNSNKSFVLEKLYGQPYKFNDYESLSKLSEEETNAALDKFLKFGHVNAYTISKALAEHEVDEYSSKFSVAIVRPSQIVGALREPEPGWTDSKNGPNGFFMGASMGLIRRLPVNRNIVYDYIPVDLVVNEILVAGWYAGMTRPEKTLVYHCTSSTIKPFKWKLIDSKIQWMLNNYPLKSAVWYPTIKLHGNFTLFRISTIFLHFLPGIIFDLLLKLNKKKPRLFKLHCKVDNSLCRLAPFIFREWFFDCTNTKKLLMSITEKDRIFFDFDISSINYDQFFESAVVGVRRYLNKEPDETLEKAKKKIKIFYFLNRLLQLSANTQFVKT
ncbi:male sterility domain-containing protein, putative [Pediculus humanus corporis]|uniref:Fatty acyl-CoA reductase n=1 Tax=Pediculus humanus subsp. corporis TaxID=121224 RepID=E0VLK0_PEDHC|nr:male sterility domain-containing protein, putative [Pediculus humanus corporis]EEB14256.1 male sterility domain-containing protein, putative [Pediculus humanus corporis]